MNTTELDTLLEQTKTRAAAIGISAGDVTELANKHGIPAAAKLVQAAIARRGAKSLTAPLDAELAVTRQAMKALRAAQAEAAQDSQRREKARQEQNDRERVTNAIYGLKTIKPRRFQHPGWLTIGGNN